MKLFNFPSVVQKEIFDHLSINHAFFLSLCSKTTKNLIKHTQKSQYEKIERVIYFPNGKAMPIEVKMASVDGTRTIMCLYGSAAGYRRHEDRDSEGVVRVNVLGTSIEFFRSLHGKDLQPKFYPNTVELIYKKIHQHLNDLLGNHTGYSIISCYTDARYLPTLPNIKSLEILGTEIALSTMDKFLAQSTCLEYLSWNPIGPIRIELKDNPKIFNLDTVSVETHCSWPVKFMKLFNGRMALLSGNNIGSTDVIEFLNAWKSGEKFGNLEVFRLKCDLDMGKIRESVQFKEVKKDVVFKFQIKEEHKLQFTADKEEYKTRTYLVRESDGHVAPVRLTKSLLLLGVWELTEKEFLEKFQ